MKISLLITFIFMAFTNTSQAGFKLPHDHEFNFMYILENHYNYAGGIEQQNVIEGLAVVTLSEVGLNLIPKVGKSEVFISVMGYHGKSPSRFIGDVQWTSNIDTARAEGIRFYESYFKQDLFIPELKFRFGLLDVSSEYNVNEPALLFVHSSPGTSAEIGASGIHGAPIYPFPSWGFDLKYQHASGFYAMALAADEYSGNKKEPSQAQKSFRIDPNYNFHIFEIGVQKEKYKVAAGYWGYAQDANHINKTDPSGTLIRSKQEGFYTMLDVLINDKFHPFLRLGTTTDEDTVVIKYNFVPGLVFNVPFGLEKDQAGIMFSRAAFSKYFLEKENRSKKYEDAGSAKNSVSEGCVIA